MHALDAEIARPFPGLQLRLMGVPEARLNGVPLTFSRRRALALLVYLAVTGHVHTRDVLATLLSGEASESQARKRLSNALAELRQVVGDYVVTTRDTAAFNTQLPSWTDVGAFRTALARGMEEEGLEPLKSALGLYHEEFLSGLAVSQAPGFDEWIMLQGEALRTQAVQGLRQLVARAVHGRATTEGIVAARRLISLEPWLEEAHRQLMVLLTRDGQRQEALAQYEICRSLLMEELGEDPSPETSALYERIKNAHSVPPTRLPARSEPLLGREKELSLLATHLADPECRLITLAGLGGSGKTCLALEATHLLASAPNAEERSSPDGIYFVHLGPPIGRHDDADGDVVAAIGNALTIDLGRTIDATEMLCRALKPKALLLVLDGSERMSATDVDVVARLLSDCPELKLLVTGRRRLGLPGEHVLVLGGLEMPSGPEDLDASDSSRLLLAEAQRARLDFVLHEVDRSHVVQLCQLVRGLPLALKYLGRWLPTLSAATMVEELERNLDLLSDADPGIDRPHRDMRAVVTETWNQLSDEEQLVLCRLSSFPGEFDCIAAREVAIASNQQISSLLDSGVIVESGSSQYAVHNLVQFMARRELRARPGELAETNRRYAEHIGHLIARRCAGAEASRDAREVLAGKLRDARDAWSWSISHGAWELLDQLGPALSSYYAGSTRADEGVRLLGDAVAALRFAVSEHDGTKLRTILAGMLVRQTSLLIESSRYDEAEQTLMEAAESSNGLESLPLEASIEYERAVLYGRQARLGDGLRRAERAADLARTAGLDAIAADSRLLMGQLRWAAGDPEPARQLVGQALLDYRELGHWQSEVAALIQLGLQYVEQGDLDRGRLTLEHAERTLGESDAGSRLESALLGAFGVLNTASGMYAQAEIDLVRALNMNREIGWREPSALSPLLAESGCLTCLGRLARIQGDVTTARKHLIQAFDTCEEMSSRVGGALVCVEMSLLGHLEGNEDYARRLAEHALQVFEEMELRQLQRTALVALGHAEVGLHRLSQAAMRYGQALELHRRIGHQSRVIESTADLARVSFDAGDRVHAAALLDPILHDLLYGNVSSVDEPARAYLGAYEILHAIGDPRAGVLLEMGCRLLQVRTARIPDKMRRLRFLQSVAPNRDLLHAHTGNGVEADVVQTGSSTES